MSPKLAGVVMTLLSAGIIWMTYDSLRDEGRFAPVLVLLGPTLGTLGLGLLALPPRLVLIPIETARGLDYRIDKHAKYTTLGKLLMVPGLLIGIGLFAWLKFGG